MSNRVLLAIPESALALEAAALIEEGSELQVAGLATTVQELYEMLSAEPVDVVLVHQEIGSMSAMDLTRELGAHHPEVGVVMLVEEPDAEVLRAALQAGARGVVGLPLSLDELQSTTQSAAQWSAALQARVRDERTETTGRTAKMIAVAGAKGGTGATVIAVHTAMRAATRRGQSVCLVDFDLQAGDVRLLLDLSHRRSVIDLVDVAGDLNVQHLDEALYPHRSGLRVLLPPPEGERAEEVDAPAARAILGGIRSRFDVVIVDVGTTVTDAGAVAVEMADDILVVATPDVPCMRAVNRLLQLWDRLQVRTDGVRVLLNQTSKAMEVQPELAGKVLAAPLLSTSIPAGFKELQPAVNTGAPDRLEDGATAKALDRLAGELGLLDGARSANPSRNGRRGLRHRSRQEVGALSVELSGLAPLLALTVLLVWQLALIGYTFVLSGNAAQEGSRALAVGSDVRAAAEANLPPAWQDRLEVEEGGSWVEVRLGFPIVWPNWQTPPLVTSRMGTVIEE